MAYTRQRTAPYSPGQTTPYKLSRSKIELYTQCPRCFWLGERHKIKRPDGPPFNINKVIDELFKKEFDVHRKAGTKHPLQEKFGINAKPFQHKDINVWRANFTGVSTLHEPTNFHIFGAVDDVWINDADELIVVDYKATAKDSPVTALGPEGTWHDGYRRQMEIYQWLLRQNDFKVSNTGYFVYATGDPHQDAFDDKIVFTTHVFPHEGKDAWVEETLLQMKKCLDGDIPSVGRAAMGGDCDYCSYSRSRTELTLDAIKTAKK